MVEFQDLLSHHPVVEVRKKTIRRCFIKSLFYHFLKLPFLIPCALVVYCFTLSELRESEKNKYILSSLLYSISLWVSSAQLGHLAIREIDCVSIIILFLCVKSARTFYPIFSRRSSTHWCLVQINLDLRFLQNAPP